MISSRDTASPASSRISTQSKPFSLGERAQPGAPSTGWPPRLPDQHQIAGIDRHAEMLDAAADRLDRGRDHVAPVGDGGRAEHDDEFGAFLQHLVDRLGERALLVRHPRSATILAPAGARRALGDPQRLLDHLGGEPRQQGRHHADLADAVGRDADERRWSRGRERRVARLAATANGMIFTVAIISPATTGL